MNKMIRWNPEKAKQIRDNSTRGGVSFEECAVVIESGNILDTIDNPSANHPNQGIYVLEIEGYAYSVPFVEGEDEIFLKTMFPSRKLTALYLGKNEP